MTELTHFITTRLLSYYSIEVASIALLSVGADINASIYKVQASDQKTYFVKLKRGHSFDVNSTVLQLLHMSGMQQLIMPIKTVAGKLAQQAGDFTLIVYPFIQGQDGFSRLLTDKQWIALGRALRQVHEVDVPAAIRAHIRHEDFSPKWRDAVRALMHIDVALLRDEIALNIWQFHQENKSIMQRLVNRAEKLCQKACSEPLTFVLCHSDIHAGNVLIDDKDTFYIVDWDDPILAPKERDLMFIGGAVANLWNKADEGKLFYQGYGEVELDWTLLAYYRHERIVEDIAVYSQELLFNSGKDEDRLQMYAHFMDMFVPNGVVDVAFETDKRVIGCD
jgi:spectinomycin phosphotransferase